MSFFVGGRWIDASTGSLVIALTFAGPQPAGRPPTYDRDVLYTINISNAGAPTDPVQIIDARQVANEALKQRALTDPLTGLPNRARFNDRVQKAIAKAVGVTASLNRSKGDKDVAEWLPPINHCRYLKDWLTAKVRWGLSQDSTEKAALQDLAAGCTNSTITVTVVG